MMRRLRFLFVLLVAAGGCKRPAATTATTAPSATAAPATRLALTKPDGNAPVDVLITRLQVNLALAPQRIDAWVVLGRAWIRKARELSDSGFYLYAASAADAVEEIESGNRLGLGLRSQVLLNEHSFDDARSLSERILASDPDDLIALAVKSDAELELGRIDEATASVQRMIDLKPALASYTRASYLRFLHGDNAGAKDLAKQAIGSGRDHNDPEPGAWALVAAADIFWSEGDYAGADAGYDLALGWMTDFPPALVGKGRVAMTKGDGKRAASLLTRAYAASPLVTTAWYLGDAKALAGDAAGAAEAYALVEKRGKKEDKRTLALFYGTKSQHADDAVKLCDEERKGRGDLTTEDACALAYLRAGKPTEARAFSDKALAFGTKDASYIFHAGLVRIAQGDAAEGQKLVKKALATSPEFDVSGAKEARAIVGAAK